MTIASLTGADEGVLAVLKGLGATCWNLGLYDEAEAALKQALARPETSADLAEEAAVRSSLGVVLRSQRRYAAAVAHLEEALRIAKEMGDARAEAYILNALGNVYQEAGDLPRAQECYLTAIEHRKRLGDKRGEGWSCYYLGQAHADSGDLVSARQFTEVALSLAEQTKEKELKTRIQITLSAIHSRLDGREAYEAALQHARNAVELSRENCLAQEELIGLSQQAIAALLLGKFDQAMSLSEEAVRKLEQGGPTADRENIWLNHSRILRAAGRGELADHSFDRAYEAMSERLASVRDEGFRESILNTRIVREILAGRSTRGQNHATLSN
jgi:tetratricopeptide (TPR) repeat protein